MKLLEMKKWKLQVSEEAWGLLPFKKILDNDKSKEKEQATKEMTFLWFYCDIRSNYLNMPPTKRIEEIKKDIGLKKTWKVTKDMEEAIRFYNKEETALQRLYKQTLVAVQAIGDYLENAAYLLAERDNNGRPVNDIAKITGSVQKVPKLMSDVKEAYKEVVKEIEDTENKKKGSKTFNTFEEGLKLDE